MMTKLKNHFLRFLLSHTSVYLKDQELLLSDDEKLDLFKQIVRSIKQVLATDHVKGGRLMKLLARNNIFALLSLSRFLNTLGAAIYNLVFVVFAASMPQP